MGFLGFLKNKCDICGKKGNLKKVFKCYIYENEYYAYHSECLKDVIKNPEKYTNLKVDKAIEITDILEEMQKIEENKKQERQKKLDKVRNKVCSLLDN